MIPENFVREWQNAAPWKSSVMVEQDLVICRTLVQVFSDPLLAKQLAFRGGTALHKLHMAPASRYSEDIDLVQIAAGPIGPVFDSLQSRLGPLLGKPLRKQGPDIVSLTYRLQGSDTASPSIRLKVEINSREHFTVLGIKRLPFHVTSRWFTGQCEIATYQLEELLGTKLRALYQRRKGRDLFDLWFGLTHGHARPDLIVQCFRRYMEASNLTVSGPEYRQNMEAKLLHPDFIHDMDDLLRSGVSFDIPSAYAWVNKEVLSLI